MVRNYKKKRPGEVNEDDIKNAVDKVVSGEMKLSEAAESYNVKVNTLFYRVKRHKNNIKPKSDDFTSKYTVAQVFDNAEENLLCGYLLKSSKMNYGLTYKQTRTLAYEYATALKKCPPKWTQNKEAGVEWMKGFMKRHKELSLRKPENTSLSRSTSFNLHNVTQFYDNYEKVLKKYAFSPDRIFNLDETNIMTVVQAPNVIAKTGAKQVGQAVSAERGQLITMCGIANAIGNALPPVFIFPRARFHDSMLFGAPPGSVGYANSPSSGWMTGPLFIKVLEHIKRQVRCTKDDPILLLMDNHESHCTLDAINFCRDNGMVALTFPPHCTHQMQPLDVAVNGPFKQKLSVAQNDWLLNHPGKTITIHDLAGIVTPAYNVTYVARNILSGFSKPGIYPFSRNAFSEEDFDCAEVTNRPCPNSSSITADISEPPASNLPAFNAHSSQSSSDGPNCTVTSSQLAINSPNLCSNLVSRSACNNLTSPTALHIPNRYIDLESQQADKILTSPPTLNTPNCDDALVSSPAHDNLAAELSPATVPTLIMLATRSVFAAFKSSNLPGFGSVYLDMLDTLITPPPICKTPENHALYDCDIPMTPPPLSPSVLDASKNLTIPFEDIVAHHTQTTVAALTPEMVKPFPKAPQRTESRRGRKKGRSRIITDTPEKTEIEAAYLERAARLKQKKPLKSLETKKQTKTKVSKRKTSKIDSSSEENTDTELVLESEDEIETFYESSDGENRDISNDPVANETTNINVGDFVLVGIASRKQPKIAFVGKVETIDGSGFIINFLKRKGLSEKFFYPEKEDKSFVLSTDILNKLPEPNQATGTSRTKSMFTFKFNFKKFKLG